MSEIHSSVLRCLPCGFAPLWTLEGFADTAALGREAQGQEERKALGNAELRASEDSGGLNLQRNIGDCYQPRLKCDPRLVGVCLEVGLPQSWAYGSLLLPQRTLAEVEGRPVGSQDAQHPPLGLFSPFWPLGRPLSPEDPTCLHLNCSGGEGEECDCSAQDPTSPELCGQHVIEKGVRGCQGGDVTDGAGPEPHFPA